MSLHTGNSVRQFPEPDTTNAITEGAESSNGTAAQSHSQSAVKPFGSAAAKFKIRSAKTLTTKDLRTKSSFFKSGKVEDSSQKNYPSKDLNKVCTTSGSFTHTNVDDKETGKTTDTRMDSTLLISSKKDDVTANKLNTQEEESQTTTDMTKGNELRRFYQSNKSKSLDWRATGDRAGHGNRTGMVTGTRDFNPFMRQSESVERTETNERIASYTQEDQPSNITWRIQAYNAANQTGNRNVFPISGSTSVRMNRVNFALERASNGQSLPSRLKPRLSQGSIGESSGLWAQQEGESSHDQTDNRIWTREQGPSNAEEVTGNQTITERIAKLFGADAKSDAHSKDPIRLKRSNTVSSDPSFPKTLSTVGSTPSHRKYTTVFGTSSDCTDSQQEKPSHKVEKAGTFSRGLSKTYFGPKQEPSTNSEKRNEQRDNSSESSFSMSSKPKWNTETSSVKKAQPLPEDNKETIIKNSSHSLERTRSRLSATAQYRNQSAATESSSSISNIKCLITTSGAIKEEIGRDKQSDEETTKRLDINENRYLDGITQPKYPLTSTRTVHNEINEDEEKDDVFTCKTEARRGEGVLEKFRMPSLDSVKNTISMFESLAQQSKGTAENLRTRRAFSVPEHPRPGALVKKSDSDKNLHFGRVMGSPESQKANFFSKSDSSEVIKGNPHSNSTVKVRPTLEQHQETHKKSVDLAPTFKQSKMDQVINKRDEDERWTVNKIHNDEPDSAVTAHSREEKAGVPQIYEQTNVKTLLKQQTIHVKTDNDDDDESTPINSPDRSPDTISIQKQSNTGAAAVNGTYLNPSHRPTPVQTTYPLLNYSNNNNYEVTRKDLTTQTTNMARWSSDEEDYEDEETDTEEDSDSGESSVTITSNMSQSDRRSFSLSLVELCNFGGVDYKPSDGSWSKDDEDLPSTRSASLSSDISALSSVTLLSTDELDRLLDDVRGLGDDTLKKYEDVQVVVLHKEVGSGLGFTLAGGVDQNKPVTVHKVIPGGVAAQEGSIFEGAQVLSINGTALQNSAHWEALHTLRKARGQRMAVVVLQSGGSRKEAIQKPGITGRRLRVTLMKSSSDLGFSLEGGMGSSSGDKPIIVQKIFCGGPVNEVFPGDELLEVQGERLEGLMRLEAWKLIKNLPSGPVEVLLHRPQQPH